LQATNAAGTGTATLHLTVNQAAATLQLHGLTQVYDGEPKAVTPVTDPTGLGVNVTYDGENTAPHLPGTYAVEATITDANHSGVATGTLTISVTALVRHAPILNGGIDGSVQVFLPESVDLNGGSILTGDLLTPGTPTVRRNGNAALVATKDESGAATPTNHTITLSGQTTARYIVRRVDPIDLPSVTAPQAPSGSVDMTLNQSSQAISDFASVRNLTLNGNAGVHAVPPGAYGEFIANGQSGFILGVQGGTEPAVYHLQRLTLNGAATLRIVGPVVLKLAQSLILSSGNVGDSGDLTIELSQGGLTLNGDAGVRAVVLAPNGTITLNGNATLTGRVSADRLVINGHALLEEASP
jgi:rhamnogalacturonan endolyase